MNNVIKAGTHLESKGFLEVGLLSCLRNLVDKFVLVKCLERQGFFYAILDRLDKAVPYLNEHATKPESDEAYIIFIVYSKMIVEAVEALRTEMKYSPDIVGNDSTKYRFFVKYWRDIPIELGDNEKISDDDFFRYLRALSFAHCLGADRGAILKGRRETHYSPWVCVDDNEFPSRIGVRLYTDKNSDEKSLLVEFDDIKNYIRSRYEEIRGISNQIAREVREVESSWKRDNIKLFGDIDLKLSEIIRVAKNRRIPICDFERARLWCSIQSSDPLNDESVEKYRKDLEGEIEKMIFHMNNLHTKSVLDSISKFVHFDNRANIGSHHDLQAIFQDLNSCANKERREFAFKALMSWSKGFPKKWVTIVESMSLDEMQMLAMVACYLEAKEQGAVLNSKTSKTTVQDEKELVDTIFVPICNGEIAKANAFVAALSNTEK